MKLLAPVTKYLSRKSSFDQDQAFHLAEQAFGLSSNSLASSHSAAHSSPSLLRGSLCRFSAGPFAVVFVGILTFQEGSTSSQACCDTTAFGVSCDMQRSRRDFE